MKLQKQVAYKYKGSTQYKYVIVIPNETVEELGWKAGEQLQNSVNGRNLTIKPKGED
jgi:bifunctional DNA-binding transcriptional regulator/antitoxin component of YhaV-PrlF toxin-antitoxin module